MRLFKGQQVEASIYILLALSYFGIRVKTHQFLGDDRASSFCDDRKFNDSEREPIGIITLLQEDIIFPEALLAVVTSQVNGNFGHSSTSSLVRLHQNGTSKWLTGTQRYNALHNDVNTFLFISALHQFGTSILIADPRLSCFRSFNITSNRVSEYSGRCFPSELQQTVLQIIDGPLYQATYREPLAITTSPSSLNKILVSDRNKVREIDLLTGFVITLYTRKVPYNSRFILSDIIWQGNFYIVASNEGLHKFSKEWVFVEHLVRKHVTGGITDPEEYVAKNLYMTRLTDDVIILKYITIPKNPKFIDGSIDILEHVTLFSLHDASIITYLYADYTDVRESNSTKPSWRWTELKYSTNHKLYFSGGTRTSGLCAAVYVKRIRDYCVHDSYRYKVGSLLSNQTDTLMCELDHSTLDVDWVQSLHRQLGPNITNIIDIRPQTPSTSDPSVVDDLVANTTTTDDDIRTTSRVVGKQLSSDTVNMTTKVPQPTGSALRNSTYLLLVRNTTTTVDLSFLDCTQNDQSKTIIPISITGSVSVTILCCVILAHRFRTGKFLWQRCHKLDETIANPNTNRALPLTPHQPGLSEDADAEYSTVGDPVPDIITRHINEVSSIDAGEPQEETFPYNIYDVPIEHDEHFEYVLDARC